MRIEIGIDEAGRGPLVGAVYAAAVVLDPSSPIAGLADSKKLSASRREQLEIEIKTNALSWAVSSASVGEIDSLNILQATMLAMRRACESCVTQLELRGHDLIALVDGNRNPKLGLPTQCIVKGDATVQSISAASILAKTARDASMKVLDAAHPQYGFAQHKGYGTASHIEVLQRLGPIAEHRRSFAPVRFMLAAQP